MDNTYIYVVVGVSINPDTAIKVETWGYFHTREKAERQRCIAEEKYPENYYSIQEVSCREDDILCQ